MHRHRHRMRVALWNPPGGNLGRRPHLRGLDPQSRLGLRIRLRKVPVPLGKPWLQWDQKVPQGQGRRERPQMEGKRGPEGFSRV